MTCEEARSAIDNAYRDHSGVSPEEHTKIIQAYAEACFSHVYREQIMAGYVVNCSACLDHLRKKGAAFGKE